MTLQELPELRPRSCFERDDSAVVRTIGTLTTLVTNEIRDRTFSLLGTTQDLQDQVNMLTSAVNAALGIYKELLILKLEAVKRWDFSS